MSKNPFDDPNFGNDLSPQGAGQQPAKKKEPKNPFDDPNYGKDPGVLRSLGDTAVAGAQGAITGAEMVSNVFGADNQVSKSLRDANEFVGGFKSGGRRAEQDASSYKMDQAAESGSLWEEVKAGASAFADAPIDMLTEAVGTQALPIAANILTRGKVPGAMFSGAQGVGVTKGSMYEAVKQEHLQAGATEEEAEARAVEAQSYSGPNSDQIMLGGGLGVLAGATGIEPTAGRIAQRLTGDVAGGAASRGLARDIATDAATGALKEMPFEALQGGHEQFAGNVATNREGFDTPLMRGVAGNATMEGLAGGGAGAGAGIAEGFVSRRQREQDAINGLNAGQQDPQAPQNPQAPTGEQAPSWTSPGQVPEQYRRESLKPSEQMGLDPNAGPMSEAASIAVDTGVTQQLNPGAAPEVVDQASFLQGGTMVDPETGEVFGLPAEAQETAPQEPTPEARRANAEQRLNTLGQMARSQGWTPAMIAERNRAQQELDSLPVSQQAQEIEQAASEAATSSANSLPEPTEAQKEAGNYKKGHVRVQGLDVTIENPRGSIRKGKRPDGSEWQHEMSDHYGYIKRTKGADSEQIDVYVGPQPDASQVFVIDQLNQETGEFDEHKVMMGYPSQQAAVVAYKSNFDPGWQVGPVRPMAVDEFKGWLKGGNTAAPASEAPAAPAVEPAPVSDGQLDIKAITRKQIPDMTDAEIEAAIAHYGPRSKRTHKLQREQAKRKSQAPAPQPAQAPAPQQATEQPYVDKAVADSAGYEQRTNDRIERIKRSNDPDEIYQIMVEHGQDDAGHPEGYSRVQQIAKNRRDQIESPQEPGIVETSGSERQAQGVADNLAKANPGKSYRVERRQGGFGEYYAVIDNELNPPKGSNAGPQSDSPAVQEFIDGKRDTPPSLEEVAAEQQAKRKEIPLSDDAVYREFEPGDVNNNNITQTYTGQIIGKGQRELVGGIRRDNGKAEFRLFNKPVHAGNGKTKPTIITGDTLADAYQKALSALNLDETGAGKAKPKNLKEGIEQARKKKAEQKQAATEKPVATAPEHLASKGKPLDHSNKLDRVAPGESKKEATVDESIFAQDGVPLPIAVDDFKEITDEYAALFESPEKRTITEQRVKGQPFISQDEAKSRLDSWKAHVKKQFEENRGENSDKTVISLFDLSGEWSKPYREAGYNVITFDIQTGQDINDFSAEYFYDNWEFGDVYAILAACPCTDFSSSNNAWYKKKDADGRTEASKELVYQTIRTIEMFRPQVWAIENPVGRIKNLTGIPDARLTFHPHHFGLPYTKKTMIYGNFNPELPLANVDPVYGSLISSKYGGGSQETKNARSVTPESFSYAFFMANNAVDTPAIEALPRQYPEASGAIRAALKAGVPEAEVISILKGTYDDDPEASRNDLAKASVDASKPASKPSVIDKVKARKASDAVDDTAIREQIEAIAARWENELGDEGMAAAVRGGLRLPRRQTEAQLAFQQTKLDEALAKKNGTEAPVLDDYTLESVVAKNQREGKDYQEVSSHPEFKQLYEVAGKAVDDVVTYLNDNGYSINRHWEMPEATKELTRKTKGMTGVMSRVTKKAVAVVRDYKRANPKQMEEAVQEAQADINEIRSLLGQPKFDFDPFNVPGGKQSSSKAETPAPEAKADDDLGAMFDDVLDEVTGGGEADAPRSINQIDADEIKRIQESARYLKDFAYSAGELPSIDARAKLALSKELGKSGRDTLLMAAFNIDREAAHTINNRLDDRQPRQLRRQDMAEAYSEFPGLREIVVRTVYGNEPQAGERREPGPNVVVDRSNETRGAGEALGSAAKNAAKGLTDAIDALGQLFGGGGRLSSGLTFDEDTYAKAKPLFLSAVSHLKTAGQDLRDTMKAVVQMVVDRFGADTAKNMKPYVVRFIEDVRDGNVTLEGVADERSEVRNDGPEALDEVAPEQGGRPEGRGAAGSNAANGGQTGSRDGAGADGAGLSATRGGRSGSKRAGTSKTRSGSQSGAVGAGGRSGAGSDLQADSGQVDVGGEPTSKPNIPATNFEITDEVGLGKGGEVQKFNDNLAAIRVIKQLEAEKRRATPDEQAVLAKYVGWGGLASAFPDPTSGKFKDKWKARGEELRELLTDDEYKAARRSTRNAHYTSQSVVSAMWKAVERMGFKGGLVLESSMGTGNFLGLSPKNIPAKFIGVEYDSLTSRIAGALYPQATVLHSGFQKVPLTDNSFALNIGNPPFGSESLRFQYKPELKGVSIHNQFFRAGMDALRPGGIQAMVVSRYLMDAQDKSSRLALAKEAELVGAIRLPDTAFKENARTEVVTDIIFLQKRTPEDRARMEDVISAYNSRPKKGDKERERQALADQIPAWVETDSVPDPLGGEPMRVNAYFKQNPDNILGTLERSGSMQHGNDITVRLDNPAEMGAMLDAAIERLPEGIQDLEAEVMATTERRFAEMSDALRIALANEEVGHVKFDADGGLVRVIEYETPEGGYELKRQPVKEGTPWHDDLALDADGKWYVMVAKEDDKGNKVKVLKNGKPTKLNVYERKVFDKESDIPKEKRLSKLNLDRLTGIVKLRDLLKRQLELETADAAKVAMEGNRKALKREYEAFVKKHGPINASTNLKLAMTMPDGGLVAALEVSYQKPITKAQSAKTGMPEQPEKAEPAPILEGRVVPKYEPASRAESPSDALAISLSETGRVSMPRIASLLEVDESKAAELLQQGDSPLVFFDPERQEWETADAYLSGMVKRKLKAASQHGLDANVRALEAVIPEDWTAENVAVQIGATWVPPRVYAEFAEHITGGNATASFSPLTNSFALSVERSNSAVADEWSADGAPADYILSRMMNSQPVKVTYRDAEGKTHVDKERTSLAILKSKEIASEFEDWIFKDSDRRAELVELFNENFNVRVNRQYNGQHLTLPGKVPDSVIKMRRHQLNAIWRGIYERFMLTDHAVGAGKTFTAIARAMERRRMGLSQKPMIVVPNHLVEQWQADVYKLYPGAKVLAAGKKDFEKKNRRKLFGKIATGDWDIVIVPHSSFGFIGISPDTEQRYLEAELKEAMDAVEAAWEQAKEDGTDSGYRKPFGVKEAERLAEKIQARMDKLNEGVRDRLLTFEQLGVDDLTVDEAHEFKNLAYSSRLTGVRGMGDKTGSRKANDLYNKIRVLRENPNSSVTFLTGTPISNSAVEMFTMLRYLAADELNELGMTHFDAFRSQFVEATPAFEPTESGRLKEVTRLGRTWSNMRSLMDLYYEVTDAVTLDDIKGWYAEDHGGKPFPVPKVKGGKDRELRTIQPTPAQDAALKVIMDGFDSLENIQDTMERNAERLRLMDRARKVSLDVRAVDSRNPSKEEGGKLEVVSKEVKRIYDQWNDDKGTQLIFLDRSVPKSNSDAKLIREYDKAVAGRDKALAEGNEADLQKYSDKLEAFDENEMEELKTAQNGGWNAYQQIKDNLVAMGIPANEIRFVQEANNDEQKAALFDSVNSGKVRVLIGSTPRMGAGTNVQKRAVALHHVDVTWKPSDIEQREGRIIRQGNELLEKYGPDMEVEILAYATERTVDAKMWDLNATKLRTINGIRKYDGAFSMDFEDEESVGMAEMAALASGNPLLMERVTLESEINNLELQERAHRRKMWGLKDSLNQARNAIEKNPARIKQANERSAKVKAEQQRIADKFKTLSVNVEGETYTDRDAAMEAVKEAVELQQEGNPKARYAININGERVTSKDAIADAIGNALGDSSPFEAVVDGETFLRRSQAFNRMTAVLNEEYGPGKEVEGIELGTYKGFRLVADISVNNFMQSGEQKDVTLSLMDGDRVMVSDQTANTDAGKPFNVNSITTTMVRLDSALNNFASNTEALRLERQLESARTQVADLEARADEPFPKAEELAQKRDRLKEVVSELDGKDSKPEPGEPAGDSGPAFRRARGATPNRMNRARVEPVVYGLLKGWKGKPKIHVVDRIYELPQELQEEIRTAGAELDFRGVLWKNEVYILAPRLENQAQLEEVVLHEVVGHYGLRGIMGREMVPLLTQVYKDLGNSEKANELKQTYFNGQFNDRSLKHRLTIAEELIAHLAETGEHRHQTLLRKIVNAVRKGLRRLGFEMKITRTDLLNLLAASEQAVRSGNMSRPSKHDINFRRAYHGTPHQFDQFSLEAIGTGEGAQAFGWGLYFASKRSVAEFYRDNVTAAQNDYFANYDQLPDEVRELYMKFSEDWEDDPDAAETYQWQFEAYGWTFEYDMYGDPVNLRPLAGEGNLYQVEIPDDDKLLDWERRLDDQNLGITEAVRAVTDEHHGEGTFDNWMEALGDGGDYRNWRDNLMEDVEDRELSLRLGAKGVPGLRYLDADSRIADADGNTYNYVIWDDRVVSVQAVNDEIDQAQAAFSRTKEVDAGEQADTGQEPLFSRKPSEASRKQAAAAFGKKTARSLKGKLADLKPAGLGALPLMYLRDFAPKTMTALDDYLDQKREMDAMRNEMHTRYDDIAQKWLKQRVKGSNLAGKAKLLAGITPKTAPDLDRLMHDSTIAGVDPSVDMSKQTRIPPEWKQLRERFLALPEEQQALFEEVRDAYKDQVNLLEDVIKENVRKSVGFAMRRAEREFEAEVQKARDEMEGREQELAIAAAEKRYRGRLEAARAGEYSRSLMLRKVFESMRVDEPYFPLKRFGDYFVALRDKDGNLQSFSMFEKAADMEDAADQLREQYPDLEVTVGRKSNKEELQNAIDPNFVADVQELVAEHSGDWDLADGIYQLYLQTLPDFSMRKGFIHRKKVHGYNEDAMRSFASSMFHSSYQIARLKHKLEMDELVEIAEEQAQDAEDSVDAMTVANELRRRHEWVMNPQGGQIAQNITSLAFAWQLGVTPAAALVNTTQTYMMGIPILGTRFKSEAKATKELLKASKDFVTGRGHIEKKLSGDERKAFDEFMRMGLIDKTQSHDLAGVGETGVEYNAVRHKVMSGIAFLFHHAERYNREVTAMAAYRMARESGMNHRDATKEAADLTWQVHFDYSSGNRARYMQSDTAKILLVFRQHSVNMLARLAIDARQMFKGESKEVRREAFRRMAGIFGMFALGAGMMGVPGAQALLIALNAMDDDDDPWTFEDKMRKAIYESLGETLGGMVLQGVPGTLTNTNLTDRIGMGHLWFFSPYRELEGRDAYYFWMEQMLGAFPGMIGGFFTGASVMNEGHFWRGIETMAPKAIKDALRAWRYSDEGVQSLNGFTMYDEVDLWSSVAQAMGFMPAHIAQGYERNSALKGAEQRILKERQNILNRYALAVRTSDTEARSRLNERIREFNRRNPRVAITFDTIRNSLMRRTETGIRAESGVLIDKRLNYLRDELPSP